MKFYVIRYDWVKVDGEPVETDRKEFHTIRDAIIYYGDIVGDDNLYDALRHSFTEQIYKMTDHYGYALATDFEVDPIDG